MLNFDVGDDDDAAQDVMSSIGIAYCSYVGIVEESAHTLRALVATGLLSVALVCAQHMRVFVRTVTAVEHNCTRAFTHGFRRLAGRAIPWTSARMPAGRRAKVRTPARGRLFPHCACIGSSTYWA